jgi:hypothetical protein
VLDAKLDVDLRVILLVVVVVKIVGVGGLGLWFFVVVTTFIV